MPASKKPTPRRLALYAVAGALLYFADPTPVGLVVGGALVTAGLGLRIWACGHLEKNRLVVTTGPYAFVKNPLYLGSFLVAVGIAVAASSPEGRGRVVLFGVLPALLAAFFLYYLPKKKRVEGGRLAERFGVAWRNYDEAVPDFVPRLRPYRSGDGRRFSWRLVIDNHEPPMDALVVALFASVALRPFLGTA